MRLEDVNTEILREVIEAVRGTGASRVKIGDDKGYVEVEFITPRSPLEQFLGVTPAPSPEIDPDFGIPRGELTRVPPVEKQKQDYATLFGGKAPGFKKVAAP